jgi:hypothetical protein
MAKAKKVSGVKVFLTEDEAQNLTALLRDGISDKTRQLLDLDSVYITVSQHSYWKSLDFYQIATLDSE